MDTKLTLTIDASIAKKAKKFAKEKGSSLSEIIESYLKNITKDKDEIDVEITPTVKSLRGTFKTAANLDYKKDVAKCLSKKYQ